ncbi:Protein pal1 [Coniochaeta hoffmannii]|uniref:Protein pal1 n=1 Tax=Coniochaeta hoffmannii TaxID=91930 RepID=A0AA38SAV4_9PEZI|nr:Protein pal1 [Coniochaeta hoffmannii]
MDSDKGKGLRRSGSLSARYPGDMSHRPLDTIKQEQRAAMRAPYLHNPRHKQPADIVDTLDQTGIVDVPYHHEGPYDATMANRNRKKLYSPLDAVKDSNEEAIKATPREYIQDSLVKHVPLQGTAVIPPGMPDMTGHRMEYREGADLMREIDAPGGAYKRYEGIRYRDEDLKGKGEPSFTIERDRKEEKTRLRRHAGMGEAAAGGSGSGSQVYEMQPRANHHRGSSSRKSDGPLVRQRSVSNAAGEQHAGPANPLVRRESRDDAYATNTDLRRRNTTGNKFAEGLKRRFGSLRRKKGSDEGY